MKSEPSSSVDDVTLFQLGKHWNEFRFSTLQAVAIGEVLGPQWAKVESARRSMAKLCSRSTGLSAVGDAIAKECRNWKDYLHADDFHEIWHRQVERTTQDDSGVVSRRWINSLAVEFDKFIETNLLGLLDSRRFELLRLGIHVDGVERPHPRWCNSDGSDRLSRTSEFLLWFECLIELIDRSSIPAVKQLGSHREELSELAKNKPDAFSTRFLTALADVPWYDVHERKLYFRGCMIRNWSKSDPENQAKLILAFQDSNWDRVVPIPFGTGGKLLCSTTARDFNKNSRKKNGGGICFTVVGDSVRWDIAPYLA